MKRRRCRGLFFGEEEIPGAVEFGDDLGDCFAACSEIRIRHSSPASVRSVSVSTASGLDPRMRQPPPPCMPPCRATSRQTLRQSSKGTVRCSFKRGTAAKQEYSVPEHHRPFRVRY